jgi:transposase-like protein
MDAPLSRRSLLRTSLLAGLSAEVLEALQYAHEAAQPGHGKLQSRPASRRRNRSAGGANCSI